MHNGNAYKNEFFKLKREWFLLFLLLLSLLPVFTGGARAIVMTLSRNIVVTSIVGVIYGFVSCFFIGTEMGFVIPGCFAYRLAMYFSDKSTYYDVPVQATIGGSISSIITFIVLLIIGFAIFAHKKKIEN